VKGCHADIRKYADPWQSSAVAIFARGNLRKRKDKEASTMRHLRHPSFLLPLALALTLAASLVPRLTGQDAPPVVGEWTGTLNPGGQPKKHVVVHISAEQDGSLRGTIDYPDQDVSGVQITAITYRKSTLHFESTPGLCAYDGTMENDSSRITGVWKQAGTSLDLVLKRTP
jgi:hypothetical protein